MTVCLDLKYLYASFQSELWCKGRIDKRRRYFGCKPKDEEEEKTKQSNAATEQSGQ